MFKNEPNSIQLEVKTFMKDTEARYYTRIGRYKDAIEIFEKISLIIIKMLF